MLIYKNMGLFIRLLVLELDGTPSQNGVAERERKNRHLQEVARSLMF